MAEKKQRPGGARKDEVATREYTINLHKRLHGWYGCRLLRASRLSPLPHPPDLPGAGCEQICALVLVAVDFSDGNESLGGAGLRVRQSCPACATSHFPAIDLYVLGRRAAIV